MPWDQIAAEFEPRDPANGRLALTGEAVKQHLTKLRKHRVKQGFCVPPPLDRNARRNASAVQAARLTSAFQTPTSTPKKKRSSESTPKPSTLLASVSKTKQKKAEKAKKAAAGVAKPTSSKRGRKTTVESLSGKGRDDRRTNAIEEDTEELFMPLYSIGGYVPQSEMESDHDDLPFSKKSKAKNVGNGIISDTLASLEGHGDVVSPVVASPPHYGNTSSYPLPRTVPSQSENVDWSYSSSGNNSLGSDHPFGNEFFDPFGTVTPQPFSGFAGLPAFPIETSGYTYADQSQHYGMMPVDDPVSMAQVYNNFAPETMASYSSSFMDSSVTDSGQVPMDHSQFLDEQYEEEEFEAPPAYLTDAYGNSYGVN